MKKNNLIKILESFLDNSISKKQADLADLILGLAVSPELDEDLDFEQIELHGDFSARQLTWIRQCMLFKLK